MPKYLDKTGLVFFKSKIDATYATPDEIIHPNELVAITSTEIEELFAEITLISFTFRNATYQAEEGMTWQVWVNSAYNTEGFKIEDNKVKTSSSIYVVADGDYNNVSPSSSIIANYNYQYTVEYVPSPVEVGGSN